MSDDESTEQVEDEQPDPFQEEEWVYLGPAYPTGYAWRDAQGERLVYGKLKARVFGGIYRVQVLREGDSTRARQDPTYTGRAAADAGPIQVRALKTEVTIKAERMHKNTARAAELDEAIGPLVDLASRMVSTSDRAALVEYVSSKIYAARVKR